MKHVLSLLLVVISLHTFSQDTLRTFQLTAEQAQADFGLYVRLLKETHPGLYRYHSKEEIQSIMDSLSNTLTQSIYFYDFFKTVTTLNAAIDCSHSFVMPSINYEAYLTETAKAIPHYIIPLEKKYYVLFNGTLDPTVKPGYEVLSINGREMSEIATEIKHYAWTDGSIELAKIFALQGDLFPLFYYSLIEQADSMTVRFADFDHQEIEMKVATLSSSQFLRNVPKNPANKEVWKRFKSSSQKWDVQFPKDVASTAIISITGFGAQDVNDADQAKAYMENFMDKAMKKIQKKNSESLILDLRYNSGGWDVMGTTLMSYFLQEQDSIPYYGNSYAAGNSSEFLKYSDLSAYDLAHLEEELIPQPDGTFLLREAYNLSHGYVLKRPNAFQGKIYFLIDEQTGSAAAEFSAIAKSNQLGTLVGQETNGAYGGSNGGTFISMPLTHSKIFVHTPLVTGANVVAPIQPLDRGVLPDHPMSFTLEDALNRNDVQMKFVKELIREERSMR